MTAVTFGGSTVSVTRRGDIEVDAPFNETTLLSGETYIQASSKQKFVRKFECYTESFTEISTLMGYIGQAKTLVIDGVSYTNCYIKPPLSYQELIYGSGKYSYKITFMRHTA